MRTLRRRKARILMGQSLRRRWTVHRPPNIDVGGDEWVTRAVIDADLEPGESVEVMPVAEHAALETAAHEVVLAVGRWLAETSPGQHVNTAKGRGETRRALDQLAEVLDA